MQFDVGVRLSWGDAISLYRTLAQDPGTYIGAAVSDMAYPARWADIPVIYSLSGQRWPKPFRTSTDDPDLHDGPSRDEVREAASHMSKAFRSLYEDDWR